MNIIGIDPGLSRLGFGVIELQGQDPKFLECGVHQTKASSPMSERLAAHFLRLEQLIRKHLPAALALEKIFVHINPSSAIKLGYVRGLVYLLAGQHGIALFEYAAREVKAGTTGYGGADKTQVRHMVERELPQANIRFDDESDALALALYHARRQKLTRAIAQAEKRSC